MQVVSMLILTQAQCSLKSQKGWHFLNYFFFQKKVQSFSAKVGPSGKKLYLIRFFIVQSVMEVWVNELDGTVNATSKNMTSSRLKYGHGLQGQETSLRQGHEGGWLSSPQSYRVKGISIFFENSSWASSWYSPCQGGEHVYPRFYLCSPGSMMFLEKELHKISCFL